MNSDSPPRTNTDVVCLGILVADILCCPIDALPSAGHLVLTDGFVLRVGGCAANTALDLRRLGKSVSVVGKVGGDLFGQFVVDQLAQAGVNVSAVARSQSFPTSATCIVNVRGEDRRFIHSMGANADFRLEDVDLRVLERARVLYVGGFMVMPSFTAEALATLFRKAQEHGVRTVLDVVIPAGRHCVRGEFGPVLKYTNVFLPNTDEACAITGEPDPVRQAACLADINPECTVVVTMGAEGIVAMRGDRRMRANAYAVKSLDESGAGDAFSAGFLVGMLENWPLEQTVRFASAVGASCTRALGCTDGVFGHDDAQTFVAANPLTIEAIS